MADTPPWQRSKQPDQPPWDPPPDSASPSWSDEGKGFVKGLGEGALGDVVGAGQIAEAVPGVRSAIDVIPGARSAAQWAKKTAMAPSATGGETVGRVVGGAAPFMIGGPEVGLGKLIASSGLRGSLSELAGNVALGAGSGAVQPTESGSLGSHAAEAAAGGVAGGATAPRVLGAATGLAGGGAAGFAVQKLIQQFGWEPVLGALGSLGYGIHHFGGLGNLARSVAGPANTAGKVIGNYLPAGAAGAAGGQAAETANEPQQ